MGQYGVKYIEMPCVTVASMLGAKFGNRARLGWRGQRALWVGCGGRKVIAPLVDCRLPLKTSVLVRVYTVEEFAWIL